MYVKVLQNCIFATLIFSSKGFPQKEILPENISSNNSLRQNTSPLNGPSENFPPDTTPLNIPPSNGPPDNVSLNNETLDFSPENIPPDDGLSENGQPEDDEAFDNADGMPNDMPDDMTDDMPDGMPDSMPDDMPDDMPGDMLDDTFQDGADFAGVSENILPQLPNSNEILDRNRPEAGFDLTYDEMMKLKLWPDALIPYYIDVHSFSGKVLSVTICIRPLLDKVVFHDA